MIFTITLSQVSPPPDMQVSPDQKYILKSICHVSKHFKAVNQANKLSKYLNPPTFTSSKQPKSLGLNLDFSDSQSSIHTGK